MNFLITPTASGLGSQAALLIIFCIGLGLIIACLANRHRLVRLIRRQNLITMADYLPEEEIYDLADSAKK